ncbi:MAG: sensor histidine kinase [Chloroflexota bacterium]
MEPFSHNLWQHLTRPHSRHPDDARREYLARAILLVMALVALASFIATLFLLPGYQNRHFDPTWLLITASTFGACLVGWFLAEVGQWRWGAAIPPAIFLLVGWYAAYNNGPMASSGLAYAIAIVLTALLHSIWMQWMVLFLAIALDFGILARIDGTSWSGVGTNVLLNVGLLIGLAIIQSFSVRLLESALKQARHAAEEARLTNECLQAEATQRQKLIQELKGKNTELEQFTYTVSHDLRSPLVTIRGFLGFLEKDARAGNTERMETDIQRILAATDKMQQLLEDLLELSRIGRITNPSQEIPFNRIVEEAIELVHGQITAGKVQVVIAENMPVIYGDRTRLVQVMQNLLENATKFMGDQANPRIEIGVTSSPFNFRLRDPVFFVRDNGIGIPPEHHERVFGLFSKLSTRSDGTGIGLALVKRILNTHGGDIWVESQGMGTGTTFYFTLPLPAPAHTRNSQT